MRNQMIIGLLLGAASVSGFPGEASGIFSFKVGQIEVHMLVERQNPGNPGILVGADKALLERYIPQGGFAHSANVFLVKSGGQTILIDTGFGQTIFEKMKLLGVEPSHIDAVLLTHLHGDHIGGLQRNGTALFPQAKIYLSTREKEHFTLTSVNQGAVTALGAYGNRVISFEPGSLGTASQELLPGIFPIAAYGHTPGHTAYMVENNGSRFIIAGDFLHVALVQFPRPDISASYDMDQSQAAAFRAGLLDYAAKNRVSLGGMHLVYPAAGTVESEGSGFKFVPLK